MSRVFLLALPASFLLLISAALGQVEDASIPTVDEALQKRIEAIESKLKRGPKTETVDPLPDGGGIDLGDYEDELKKFKDRPGLPELPAQEQIDWIVRVLREYPQSELSRAAVAAARDVKLIENSEPLLDGWPESDRLRWAALTVRLVPMTKVSARAIKLMENSKSYQLDIESWDFERVETLFEDVERFNRIYPSTQLANRALKLAESQLGQWKNAANAKSEISGVWDAEKRARWALEILPEFKGTPFATLAQRVLNDAAQERYQTEVRLWIPSQQKEWARRIRDTVPGTDLEKDLDLVLDELNRLQSESEKDLELDVTRNRYVREYWSGRHERWAHAAIHQQQFESERQITLVNTGSSLIIYEMRSGSQSWSNWLRLEPGRTYKFNQEVHLRFVTDRSSPQIRVFTLQPGKHYSVFRPNRSAELQFTELTP